MIIIYILTLMIVSNLITIAMIMKSEGDDKGDHQYIMKVWVRMVLL